MSLNDYRDEAGLFIKAIGAEGEDVNKIVKMLEEEFEILKNSVDNKDNMEHQVYDMLFVLFEIAAKYNMNLDLQWGKGRKRKEQKYLNIKK